MGSTGDPALILCDTSSSATQGTAELINSSDYQFFAIGAFPLERILPDMPTATPTDAPSDLALNVVFSNDDRVDSSSTVLMAPNSKMQVTYLNGLSVTVSEDTASEGEYLFLLWTFGGAKDALSDSVFESLNPVGEFGTCAWDVYQSWSQIKHPDYKSDGSVNSAFADLYNEAVTYQTAAGVVNIADVCGRALDTLTGSDSASKKAIADAATDYSKAIASPEVEAAVAEGAEDTASATDYIDYIVDFIEGVLEGVE